METTTTTTTTTPADSEKLNNQLEFIQVDGLVVLKIIKHYKDNLNDVVTGHLLGLDFGTTLEVTNCFPFPKLSETEEDAEKNEGIEYIYDMMRSLREVNVDSNTVGWYTSTYMSEFINSETIATQFDYQEKIKQSITLVYDPYKTAQGALSLKAYRLTSKFMAAYRDGTFSKESLLKYKLSFEDIWEEIPIRIHNNPLIAAFLLELEEAGTAESDFERLNLGANPYLERNLQQLSKSLDTLAGEQTKFQNYQRTLQRQQANRQTWIMKRKQENAVRKANGEEPLPEEDPQNPYFKSLTEPPRLESLLLIDQINSYCKDINHFSANSFAKLFLSTQLTHP